MTDIMRRTFRDRADLIDYLRQAFPTAAAVDDAVAETRGGRRAAEAALTAIDPTRYASTRNDLDGAVTHLSPYLRHGIISEAEMRATAQAAATSPRNATKLINELGWRDYFQRVYATIGQSLWRDIEPYKTGHAAADYADTLPEDIRTGTTGLACMDAFSRDLRQTGYLHNHARMWLAAYIVHWRGVRWQTGARWFLSHLLDGDPASNNLSWQWVASTFSHKPYLFNRENLERFTDGVYCEQCPLRGRCELDAGYEALAERLFEPGREPDPASQSEGRKALASVEASDWSTIEYGNDEFDDESDGVIWIHGDCLDPHSAALRARSDRPAIWVWDEQLLATQQISLKRIVFLYECLLELPVTICRGDVAREVLRFARQHGAGHVVTMGSVSPGFQQIRGQIAAEIPVVTYNKEPFVVIQDKVDLRRFSRYWQQVKHAALA